MTSVRTVRTACAPSRLALVVAFLATALAAGAARAQYADPAFPVVDGRVQTSALAGNTLYFGGTFQHVGPNTGSFACVDFANGAAIPFARIDGVVHAIASDGAGGWFVGGQFASVSGVPRANLARVRGDGSLDPQWNPGADGVVLAIAPSGGYVFVGGNFLNAGGQPRRHVAALSTGSGDALAWNADADSMVMALALRQGTLWVGGRFEHIGGQQRIKIAAVDAGTAEALPWSTTITLPPGQWPSVSAIAVDGSTVYVSGQFMSIGGQSRRNLAALDATSGLASAWDPFAGGFGVASAIVPSGSTVFLGGSFSAAGGQARANLAEVSAADGVATAWNPAANGSVNAMVLANGLMIVGGGFTTVGGATRANLAMIGVASGVATAWDPGAYGQVMAIGAPGPACDTCRVIVGGMRMSMGATARANLAAIDLASGQLTVWNPGADDGVRSMSLEGSTLYLCGAFTHVGGQARTNFAALDLASGLATAWAPAAANAAVNCVFAHGNTVYTGGGFTTIGGIPRAHLAAFDASSGALTAWDPGADNWVNTVSAKDGRVFAGGLFQFLSGAPRAYVGSVDSANANALPWQAEASNVVDVLVPDDQGRVYVGGWFTQLGGVTCGRLGRVAAATGVLDGFAPQASAPVEAVAPVGSTVYAGGFFTTIGGGSASRAAKLDGTTGALIPWDPGLYSTAFTLQVANGVVYAGGDLYSAGALPLSGLAKLFPADASAPVPQVVSPNGGEHLFGGSQPWHVEWTVTDDQRVPWVDLEYSRNGPGGPWLPIATALRNTGAYDWAAPLIVTTNSRPARASNTEQAWLRVVARDLAGNVGADVSDAAFFVPGNGDVPIDPAPLSLSIASSPLRSGGRVLLHLTAPATVRVGVFDLAGREVARLADGRYGDGWQSFGVPDGLAPGVYVVRADVGGQVLAKKFAMLD